MTELLIFISGAFTGIVALGLWIQKARKPAWDKHCALAIYCALLRADNNWNDVGEAFARAEDFTTFGIDLMKGKTDD